MAATGYRVDWRRQSSSAPNCAPNCALNCAPNCARTGGSPRLGADSGTSVPGTYVTGLPAAATYGPVLRFVCGTEWASPRLAAAVTKAYGRQAAADPYRPFRATARPPAPGGGRAVRRLPALSAVSPFRPGPRTHGRPLAGEGATAVAALSGAPRGLSAAAVVPTASAVPGEERWHTRAKPGVVARGGHALAVIERRPVTLPV